MNQQSPDDEKEEAFVHGTLQIPRLEDMCRAHAYSNMCDSTWPTLRLNLPEEAGQPGSVSWG